MRKTLEPYVAALFTFCLDNAKKCRSKAALHLKDSLSREKAVSII